MLLVSKDITVHSYTAAAWVLATPYRVMVLGLYAKKKIT